MTDETRAAEAHHNASDNPPSRNEMAVRLAEVTIAVTPMIDALASEVAALGGTMCVAVEVDGHLFKRRSLRSRFDVTRRDPDDGVAVEQELAPAGTLNAVMTAFHALRSFQHGNVATGLAQDVADRLKRLLDGAGVPVPDAAERVPYPVRTVGDLIANLGTLDADTPVYGAYFVEIDGRRRARARTLSISRERVQDSHIRTGDKSVPYSFVVWSALDPTPIDARRRDVTAPPQQRPELDP